MKKILVSLILILSPALFFGCSLTPQKNTTGKSSFTFSESIWKSTNGGTLWEVKNKGEGKANIADVDILSFIINSKDKNNIYVGLRKGGILETTDGGDIWKFINFQSEKVYGLALDSMNGKKLYASGVWQGRGKIFKTEDDGQNWKEIYTSPINGPLIIFLVIDKVNPNILYATTSENEALKSVDGGISWKNIYLSNAPIIKVATDVGNSNLIYFLTNEGDIIRSSNGGDEFENITEKVNKSFLGFNRNKFGILEVDPSKSGNVYLAGSGGIALSSDAGETWQGILTLNNPEDFPIKALAINPKNSKEMIYAMAMATYKSVDGGENWMTSQFNSKMSINILKYDPTGSGELFVGFAK